MSQQYMFTTLIKYRGMTRAMSLLLSASLAFLVGEFASPGAQAAIVGALVALVVAVLQALVSWRKHRIDSFRVVDTARAKVEQRADVVHEQETLFLQRQIRYHQELEIVARNRAHNAFNEVERCVAYIYKLHHAVKNIPECDLPEFDFKTHAEIVGPEELPLPPGEVVTTITTTTK